MKANVDSKTIHNRALNESYEMFRLRSPVTSQFSEKKREVFRRYRLLAGVLALLVSTGFAVRAGPFPTRRCSSLSQPTKPRSL